MKIRLNVLFNFRSKEKKALDYLKKITPELQSEFDLNIIELDPLGEWAKKISEALDHKELYFAAAGGDGTVHALLNALVVGSSLKGIDLKNIRLGAIGLGSSNDFHKPINKLVKDIPLRLNFNKSAPWDIVQAIMTDKNNVTKTVSFSISGSVGLVAEANSFFNSKDPLLTMLKRNWTEGAILYSAFRQILMNRPMDLSMDGTEVKNVSALCFLKTNFLSGTIKINQPISHCDGKISFVLIKDMGKLKLIKTLNELENNVFNESESLSFFKKDSIHLSFNDETIVELDGEIYKAKSVKLSILPEKIMVASNE
ncbi:MAG: diacylglycerol/lipid kinase family protein [Bacteriovorax sp.]